MAKHLRLVVAVALLAAPAAGRAAGSPAAAGAREHRGQDRSSRENRPQEHRWKWWINPEDRREFGITDQQSAQINQIWESYAPAARERVRELEKLEADLAQTIKEGKVDVATLTQQVARVEKLRAEQTTYRTVMLYRIMQVLTPEQRPKVEALLARRAEARRRQQSERDKSKSQPPEPSPSVSYSQVP